MEAEDGGKKAASASTTTIPGGRRERVTVTSASSVDVILKSVKATAGVLDLSNQKIGRSDVILLARALGAEKSYRNLGIEKDDSRLEAAAAAAITTLNLYNLRISPEDTVILAKGMEFNDSITSLNFQHNSISTLGVSALAESFKFSRSLRNLSLSNAALNSTAAAIVASALGTNQSLTCLNLEGNHLIGAAGAQALAEALTTNAVLVQLNIAGCALKDEGAAFIARALSVNNTLEELDLKSNDMTQVGAKKIGEALLKSNTSLRFLIMNRERLEVQFLDEQQQREYEYLDLHRRQLSAQLDYPILMKILARYDSPPRSLCLGGSSICGIAPDGRGQRSAEGVSSLCTFLHGIPQLSRHRLVKLDLSHNFLEDGDFALLSVPLRNIIGLTSLNVSRNNAGPLGVIRIAGALAELPSITELNFSANPRMGPQGAQALASALGGAHISASLRILDLSETAFGTGGAKALAACMINMTHLEEIHIQGNGMDGEGVRALGEAFLELDGGGVPARLKTISCDFFEVLAGQRELDLSERPLSSSAQVVLVAGAVSRNSWLRRLTLDGTPIDEKALAALLQVLESSTHLAFISLRNCSLAASSAKPILSLLSRKPGLEIDVQSGNFDMGSERLDQISAASLAAKKQVEVVPNSIQGITVHLLGNQGAGKSALRQALPRNFWTSLMRGDLENADDCCKFSDDRGVGGAGEGIYHDNCPSATQGAFHEFIQISGRCRFWIVDYSGGESGRFLASQHMLSFPCNLFVIVVSLMERRAQQRSQVKYWTRLIQSCVGEAIDKTAIALIGSRADRIGLQAGDEYMLKLWKGAWEELKAEEACQGGLDPALPGCVFIKSMDCRKSQSPPMNEFRDVLTKFLAENGTARGPALFEAARKSMETWRDSSPAVVALTWAEFWKRLQRDLYPGLPEKAAQDIALGLQAVAGVMIVRRRGAVWWIICKPGPLLKFIGALLDSGDETSGIYTGADLGRLASRNNLKLKLGEVLEILIDMGLCAEVDSPMDVPDVSTYSATSESLLLSATFTVPRLRSSMWKDSLTWQNDSPHPSLKLLLEGHDSTLSLLSGRRFQLHCPIVIPGLFMRIQMGFMRRYSARRVLQLTQTTLWARLDGIQIVLVLADERDGVSEFARESSAPSSSAAPSMWIDLVVSSSLSQPDEAQIEKENGARHIRAIIQEFPGIRVQELDISRDSLQKDSLADLILSATDGKEARSLSKQGASSRNPFAPASITAPSDASGGKSPSSLNPFATVRKQIVSQPLLSPPATLPTKSEATIVEEVEVEPEAIAAADQQSSTWTLDVSFLSDPHSLDGKVVSLSQDRFELVLFRPGVLSLEQASHTLSENEEAFSTVAFARVVSVCDAGTLSGCTFLGSSAVVPTVGCIVASVSRESWSRTDSESEVWDYTQVRDAIEGASVYPIFVQLVSSSTVGLDSEGQQASSPRSKRNLIIPPKQPKPRKMRLAQVIICTNRSIICTRGEFQFSSDLSRDPNSNFKWALATIGWDAGFPELGEGSCIDPDQYACMGYCLLTQDQALSLISSHSASSCLISVHGFNNDVSFASRMGGFMSRTFHQPLTVVYTWPSDPPAEGRGWLLSQVMTSFERSYTMCEHNMHASIRPLLELSKLIRSALEPHKKMNWHAHSMGCYLLMNCIERLNFAGEDIGSMFKRVILNAPDVPTWFFHAVAEICEGHDMRIVHYFNSGDQATDASRQRRAISPPYPGNDVVILTSNLEAVSCDGVRSTTFGHDYGRYDSRCVLDERDFLAGEPPEARVLRPMGNSGSWKLIL